MSALTVSVTRESVAAGDDADAPHKYTFEIEGSANLRDVFNLLADRNYLASVAGRGHS
jgi:hypothetical protein